MQWREFRMPVQSIGGFNPLQVVDFPGSLTDVSVGMITMQAEPWRTASLGVAPATVTPGQPAPPGAPAGEPLEPAIWNPWRITQFVNSYRFLDQPNEW